MSRHDKSAHDQTLSFALLHYPFFHAFDQAGEVELEFQLQPPHGNGERRAFIVLRGPDDHSIDEERDQRLLLIGSESLEDLAELFHRVADPVFVENLALAPRQLLAQSFALDRQLLFSILQDGYLPGQFLRNGLPARGNGFDAIPNAGVGVG